MNILSHPEFNHFYKLILSESKISVPASYLVAPMRLNRSVSLYSSFISGISVSLQILAAGIVKKTLERMDREFRTSPGRSKRYYVKNTRDRTLITLFGEVTYLRTEYMDRHTKNSFVYVDEEIGLYRRQRYDSVVAALAYEYYSHQSSMSEVGKILGNIISGFRLDPDRDKFALSRQQVFYMINRFSSIRTKVGQAEKTPDTLYIMADEKYIHLQREMAVWREGLLAEGVSPKVIDEQAKKKRFSEMVKLAVVFTGRTQLKRKDGTPLKRPRWKLTDTRYLAFPHDTKGFWRHVMDELSQIYDMEKVKRIYILGDGADWIRAGVKELSSQYCTVKFALDRYHLSKKIHILTKDDTLRKTLNDYAIHGDRKSFISVVDSIFENEEVSERKQDAYEYVLNQMGAAVIMQKEVKIGCAMEQAISHVLASPFTCIPKAYTSEHLHTYVQTRMIYKNGLDPLLTYITACDKSGNSGKAYEYGNEIDISKESLDLSLFDSSKTDPYYHFDRSTIGHIIA